MPQQTSKNLFYDHKLGVTKLSGNHGGCGNRLVHIQMTVSATIENVTHRWRPT